MCKGKGKGAGFKSWSQAGSHDFTMCIEFRWFSLQVKCIEIILEGDLLYMLQGT